MTKLNHFNESGDAHMVDVGNKAETHRIAVASGTISMLPATFLLVRDGTAKKGDVLGVARIAAIQGAKKSADLIPLSHPIPINRVAIEFLLDDKTHTIACRATVATFGRTGVETHFYVCILWAIRGLSSINGRCALIGQTLRELSNK